DYFCATNYGSGTSWQFIF
nr:immunoglobulin light chain junction region [Macaca mulatta]MOX17391.1 immunoglobulin light chain junction region [Macaca mulatta]MOX17946.1 immunoglobulin light chain junction region [Macaca mulatta]MOX18275.1 immunoglobulin light chain junction region [Macaca mulatta]MOX18421.1 immunoglobulin light chain junction region [Macaca mulatta]